MANNQMCVYKRMYEIMERGREQGYEFNASVILKDCTHCSGQSNSCETYTDAVEFAAKIRKIREEQRK